MCHVLPTILRWLLLSVVLCLAPVQAAVHRDEAVTFHQPDGVTFAVRITGNEFAIDAWTEDGWAVLCDQDRWWCYARPDGAGGIVPSALRVGAGDPATLGVPRGLRLSPAQRAVQVAKHRAELSFDQTGRLVDPASAARRAALGPVQPAPPSHAMVGSRKGVTLLVSFPDQSADVKFTRAQVDNFCNADAYTEFGNNGSVKRYFSDNSLGRLTYTNHVTAYYTAARNRSYYTDESVNLPTRARELVVEALNNLDPVFDFRTCDLNGDNWIDAINVFYAGPCVNNWLKGLWPHATGGLNWTSDEGVVAASYQITNMGTASLQIGTFCHENGHMLCGFPDIYDYGYDSTGGAGVFCLMNSGGHGSNPSRVCGYLALAAGWRDAVDVADDSFGTRTLVAEAAPILRCRKPGSLSEYFLIENRNTGSSSGRDQGLPCSGLAIWHCDEFGNKDQQGYAKPSSSGQHYEVALIQADNQRHFERNQSVGDSGDLWYQGNPSTGYTGRFEDGPGSDPQANDARWWDASVSRLVVLAIDAPGQTMSFNLSRGGPSPAGTLSLTQSTMTVVEGHAGTTAVTVTVFRSFGSTGAVSVQYATVNGTASAGSDYLVATGTLNWPDGDVSDRTFTILVNGDSVTEYTETVLLTLSNPTGGALLGNAQATLSIEDDDGSAITVEAGIDHAGVVFGGGNAPWQGVAAPSHDGTDAARSGMIGDSQFSDMSITVTGPATVTWWWKVSCEASFDHLRCLVDDAEAVSPITGEVNWTQASVEIAAGSHVITWRYVKDSFYSAGSDVGYVDQVVTTMSPGVLALAPATYQVTEGNGGSTTATVLVTRTGGSAGAVSVQYATANGTASAGSDYVTTSGTLSWAAGESVTKSFTVTVNGDTSVEADETVLLALSNPVGGAVLGTAAGSVTIRNDDTISVADGIDVSITVASGGTLGWQGIDSPNHDGVDAARSGAITHSQSSDMSIAVTGPATATWWWRVSSETGYDYLSCLVDGVEALPAITGETGWTQANLVLFAGPHTITWRYVKDDVYSAGDDAGYVDQVLVTPFTGSFLSLPQTGYTVVERNNGSATLAVTVTRAGGSSGAVGVQYFTHNESASAGRDFLGAVGALSWANGDVSPRTIILTVLGDTAVESDETFVVYLSDPTGGALLGSSSAATITITNDDVSGITAAQGIDQAGPVVVGGDVPWMGVDSPSHDGVDAGCSGPISDGQVSEMSIAVTGPATASWWWKVSSEAGYDHLRVYDNGVPAYGPISGEVGWSQVSIQVSAGPHTLTWRYAKDASYTSGDDAGYVDQVVIITPGAGSLGLNQASYAVGEGSATLAATVNRTGGSIGAVSVQYATSAGSASAGADFTAASGTLSWVDGDATPKTIIVTLLDDAVDEADETFTLVLATPSNGASLGAATAAVTILDDDLPPPVAALEVPGSMAEGATATVTVRLDRAAPAGGLVVGLSTLAGSAGAADYMAISQVAVAAGATSASTALVTVDDALVEGPETFTVQLLAGPGYGLGATTSASVTIVDDDLPPPVAVLEVPGSVAEGATVAMTVHLDRAAPAGGLLVGVSIIAASAGAGDYVAISQVLVAAGATSASTALATVDDALVEGSETFTVQLLAGPGYGLGAAASAGVTIVDDDQPPSFQRRIAFRLFDQAGGGLRSVVVIRTQVGSSPDASRLTTRDDGMTDDNGIDDPGAGDDPKPFSAADPAAEQTFTFSTQTAGNG